MDFIDYICDRSKKNKNTLSIITGKPGTGKSYAGLALCLAIDKDFTKQQIVFGIKEFISLLRFGNLQRGQCVLFEEAGVGHMNSKEGMTRVARAFDYLAQTFRYRNLHVFFTTPSLKGVMVALRRLLHFHLTMEGINYYKSFSLVKISYLQYNEIQDKTYRKYFTLRDENGAEINKSMLQVKKPDKTWCNVYEERKKEFNERLLKQVAEELEGIDDGIKKQLTHFQQKCFDMKAEGVKQREIAKRLNVSEPAISQTLQACYNKGYKINQPTKIPNFNQI